MDKDSMRSSAGESKYPEGWNETKEAEYQRKCWHEKNGKCSICGNGLWYGHILPYQDGYAHRSCIAKTR